jgi:hypothetical protein
MVMKPYLAKLVRNSKVVKYLEKGQKPTGHCRGSHLLRSGIGRARSPMPRFLEGQSPPTISRATTGSLGAVNFNSQHCDCQLRIEILQTHLLDDALVLQPQRSSLCHCSFRSFQ